MSFLVGLQHAFPMVALHRASMQLAVACPIAGSGSPGEPLMVHVYDLNTGALTWQLPLQPGPEAILTPTRLSAERPHVDLAALGRAGVHALAFHAGGTMLAAYSAGVPCVFVWSLAVPWSHKLLPGSRQALVLQPISCFVLEGPRGASGGSQHGQQEPQPTTGATSGAEQGGRDSRAQQQQQQPGNGHIVSDQSQLNRASGSAPASSPAVERSYKVLWRDGWVEVLHHSNVQHRLQVT